MDIFDMSSEAARFSKLLATILDDGMDMPIPLPTLTTKILLKVVSYMEYHVAHPPQEISRPIKRGHLADNNACKWDYDFLTVEQDVFFELILAANYLDIEPLLDLTCAQVLATQPPINAGKSTFRRVGKLSTALITVLEETMSGLHVH